MDSSSGGDDDECDRATIPSTPAGGDHTKKSFETHLGKDGERWAKPLTGNKIPNHANLYKETQDIWSNAWNHTIDLLNKNTKTLIQCSKKWPDEGFGGKRCVKQLFEILVLFTYVKNVCGHIKTDLSKRFKTLTQKCSSASIDTFETNETKNMHKVIDEMEQLSKDYKKFQNTDGIVRSIISDFFKNTIKSNTIKQKEHQKFVQSFVDNPTVERFEKICD